MLQTANRSECRTSELCVQKMVVQRNQRVAPCAANDAWAMDFVADQLADGIPERIN